MSKPAAPVFKRSEIHVPFITFLKIFVALLFAYAFLKLWPLALLLLLAAQVAVTLHPVVEMIVRRKYPRWLALLAVSMALIGIIFGGILLLVPPMVEELRGLSRTLPELRESIIAQTPTDWGLRKTVQTFFRTPVDPQGTVQHLLSVGQIAFGGLWEFGLLVILSIYLLADGRTAWQWLLPYFSLKNQDKLNRTGDEVSGVVFAYIGGQAITSLLAGIFAFAVLSILKVPAALVLGILAAIFDVLPIVGFFLFTIPAVMLALAVSPTTALIVLGLYLVYHAIENYLIVPKVYGDRLRLSTLVVLVGLIAGGTLAGIPGAIAILPVMASYPIIERIWLIKHVGSAAVIEHLPDDDDK